MNDQQRAAMHMALEALESALDWAPESLITEDAITALREALAQPQDNTFISYDDPAIKHVVENDELYIRGYEAGLKAQPQGEPVAWMEDSIEFYAKDHPTSACTIPLYTTPPSVEASANKTRTAILEYLVDSGSLSKDSDTYKTIAAQPLDQILI